MKKLALSAVAVLAVVTSALAFTEETDIVYCDDPSTPLVIDCVIPFNFSQLAPLGDFQFRDNCSLTRGATGANCPEVDVFESEK